MHRKLVLLLNPISGTSRDPNLPEKLIAKLSELYGGDVDVEYAPTQYAGHATEIARKAAADGAYAVVACGGDGTINETARGLIGSDTILGILPNGSGNGLARHINIPCNPLRAIGIIAADSPLECDWCEANSRPFFCSFGVGFDAAVSHRFAAQNRRGLRSYIKSAIEEFRSYSPQTYTLTSADGSTLTLEAFLVSCCNASQYGNNAYIAPNASIRDGLLDVSVVTNSSLLRYALLGMNMMAGTLRDSGSMRMWQTSSLIIERPTPGPAHLDGEPIDMPERIEIKVHNKGLRLFTNPGKRPFRPLLTPLHLR